MTTGFGIDPIKDANGLVTSGTTSEDIRQIYGSLYTAGLISGGLVTRSSSAHTYSVSTGVAAFPIVTDTSTPDKPQNRRTVLGPIPQTNLTTTLPTSGTRVDMIYAQQMTPANDSDNIIVVRIGTALPPRSVLLDAFIVSSTSASSSTYVRTGDITYSIPYGASGKLFAYRKYSAGGTVTTRRSIFTGSFHLPTDRLINVWLNAGLSSQYASAFDNSRYCEAGFDVYIDNIKIWTWSTVGLHQAWAEHHWSDIDTMKAGPHTYKVEAYRAISPGTPILRDRGILFVIQDVGPAA